MGTAQLEWTSRKAHRLTVFQELRDLPISEAQASGATDDGDDGSSDDINDSPLRAMERRRTAAICSLLLTRQERGGLFGALRSAGLSNATLSAMEDIWNESLIRLHAALFGPVRRGGSSKGGSMWAVTGRGLNNEAVFAAVRGGGALPTHQPEVVAAAALLVLERILEKKEAGEYQCYCHEKKGATLASRLLKLERDGTAPHLQIIAK